MGTVIQCTGGDAPKAFLARVDKEVTRWLTTYVEEPEAEDIPPGKGADHEKRAF